MWATYVEIYISVLDNECATELLRELWLGMFKFAHL